MITVHQSLRDAKAEARAEQERRAEEFAAKKKGGKVSRCIPLCGHLFVHDAGMPVLKQGKKPVEDEPSPMDVEEEVDAMDVEEAPATTAAGKKRKSSVKPSAADKKVCTAVCLGGMIVTGRGS